MEGLQEHLPGEERSGRYSFRNIDGQPRLQTDAIFPIFKNGEDGECHLVGTGFFITHNGVFVTAKHVLKDAFDRDGNSTHALNVGHIGPSGFAMRRIFGFSSHPAGDLAVAVAQPFFHNDTGEPLLNSRLILSMIPPSIGDPVVTYAYPNSFAVQKSEKSQDIHCNSAYYNGHIEELLPHGNGGKIEGACFRTTIHLHGGSSGGPVFGRHGNVIGINSSSLAPDISYITRINEVLLLDVRDVILSESEGPRSVGILTLAKLGHVLFDEPILRLDLGNVICDVGPQGELTVCEQGLRPGIAVDY